MAVFNEPAQWDHTLGNNADTSTLPDDAAATAGIASLQKLFQIINATPLEAGGIAPDREDVNALFKYLGDQIFYTQNGGVPSYNASYDYIPGRVILYTDNKLYKCIQANGASSTVVAPDSVSPLGSDYWKDIENQETTSLILNQTIISELPLTDANLHLKDGALLSGSGAYSDYVDLIAEIYNSGDATTSFCTEAEWQTSNTNYGFCNKFVYDSVANTVRLPKINSEHGALIKSYSSSTEWYRIYQDGFCEQGGYIPAQSSTAQQRHVFIQPFTSNVSAIITNTSIDGGSSAHNLMINVDVLGFDFHSGQTENNNWSATNNNWWLASGYVDISDLQTAPIYEYIVVGTVSKTQIQIDIDNVMSDLALKADKDFSNVTAPTQAFKNMSISWGQPDYTSAIAITLTLNTAVSYIAPEDGFIIYTLTALGNISAFIQVNGHDVCYFQSTSNGYSVTSCGIVPVHKGDNISIQPTGAGSNYLDRRFNYAEFVPCKGV